MAYSPLAISIVLLGLLQLIFPDSRKLIILNLWASLIVCMYVVLGLIFIDFSYNAPWYDSSVLSWRFAAMTPPLYFFGISSALYLKKNISKVNARRLLFSAVILSISIMLLANNYGPPETDDFTLNNTEIS